MITFLDKSSGNVLGVKASDKLTHEDYVQHLIPKMESIIAEHGSIRVLFDMVDFHGWEISAMWDDLKFDFKHAKQIERFAIVGDRKWEEMMTKMFRPFFSAKIEYFDAPRLDEAWEFIRGK